MKGIGIVSFVVLFANLLTFAAEKGDDAFLQIFSDRPAGGNWEAEWYPIGNGSMGAMLDGGTAQSHIQFNADSLWTGDQNFDGTASDASADRNYNTMGAYQNFGSLTIQCDGAKKIEGYRRTLDISKAIYSDHFVQDGISINRKAFISAPDQVLVYSVEASRPISGFITLKGAHNEKSSAASSLQNTTLSFSGALPNHLNYQAKAKVLSLAGGKFQTQNDQVLFKDCKQLVVLLVAETDYDMKQKNFRNPMKLQKVNARLSAAAAKGLEKLEATHVAAYRHYFGRLSLTLDGCDAALRSMTTSERINRCRQGKRDPELATLLYQFGRYLLICSSWPGSLPANLQGVWNNSNNPPWHGDYHTNINIQMNYWGADVANLSEMHKPLFDWMTALQPIATKETAAAFPKSKGYAYRTSTNIFGGMGWRWNLPGAAWLAHHVYDHYTFTQDKEYLKKVGYPLVKGAALFCLSNLKTRKDGTIVVPNGWSPEHGPREDGVTHDQQIVSQLFSDVLEIRKVLGDCGDSAFFDQVARVKGKLLGNKIGKWGQLQEWETDRDVKGDQHRHTSHLFAVYPGCEISWEKTPEFAKAAAISLEGRALTGDARRSWTWPWRAAMWARLHNGEKAGLMLNSLLQYNTLPNLFTVHPPFQIDGNLGIIGAISEMLLQSHAGKIEILPVVIPGWESGKVSGLRARGDLTVGFEWENGKVTRFQITSGLNQPVTLLVNGKEIKGNLQAGKTIRKKF